MTDNGFDLNLTVTTPEPVPAAPAAEPAPNPAPASRTPQQPTTPLPAVPLALAAGNAAVIAAGAAIAAPATAGLSLAGGAMLAAGVAAARKRTTRRAGRSPKATMGRVVRTPNPTPSHSAAGTEPRRPGAGGATKTRRNTATPTSSLGSTGLAPRKPHQAPAAPRPASGGSVKQPSRSTSANSPVNLTKKPTPTSNSPHTAQLPRQAGAHSATKGRTGGTANNSPSTNQRPTPAGRHATNTTPTNGGGLSRAALRRSKTHQPTTSQKSSSTNAPSTSKDRTNTKPGQDSTNRNKLIRAGQQRWHNSRPQRKEATRKARQATTAGALAGAAGALVGAAMIFSKKPYGRRAMAAVWAWRRRKKAEANERYAAKQAQTLNPTDLSANTVNDPQAQQAARRGTTPNDIHRPGDAATAFGLRRNTRPGVNPAPTIPAPTGAPAMSTFALHDAAAEFAAAASGYAVEPDEAGAMMQVRSDIGLTPEAMNHLAEGFRVWVGQLSEGFDIDQAALEALHDVYTALLAAAQASTNVVSTFESAHAEQIERHENRRVGDKGWNLT